MSESAVKKTVSFYEYLKDMEEKYPGWNSFVLGAMKDPDFPMSQDKNGQNFVLNLQDKPCGL